MDVQIRDSAALRRITPTMLRAYLQSQGWVQEDTWRSRIVVWSKTHHNEIHEVLMPLREQSDVYAIRISEIVSTISGIEKRSQLNVYYDLLGAGADVIRLRPLNGNNKSEWSLSEQADFLGYARSLVTAAARSAENPGNPVHRGRISDRVVDYMKTVRPLPEYVHGSDIVLHSKVPAEFGIQQDMDGGMHAPFPRRTTIALNRGLGEAAKTVESVLGGAEISIFGTGANKGASSNLCDALAAMAKQWHGVGINLSWATVRPLDMPDEEFQFVENSADIFTQGAEWLRQKSPFRNADIKGEIVRLERNAKEEFDGKAVVSCLIDDSLASLQVQFHANAREEVMRAFRDGIPISINGDVHREGRRYFLENPTNFSVLD